MKVLHITAHLGGGVGKAHATMRAVDKNAADHTYLLLEQARDRHYLEAVEAAGAEVIEAPLRAVIDDLLHKADIVQVEFWNHPRLYAFLARADLPAARFVFWCHISGLAPPLIADGLPALADAFVFTSACSLRVAMPGDIAVIGSGFGLETLPVRKPGRGKVRVGYLGTVDFVKMHPAFFGMVDAVVLDDFEVTVYGGFDPSGAPELARKAMRHPQRIRMAGFFDDVSEVFGDLDIFFYPLARGHFGTAENALVEAMSAGLACLVLDNPAEAAIIKDGETGLIASSVEDCIGKLDRLIADTSLRDRLGARAAAFANTRFRPENSVADFETLYAGIMELPKRQTDFARSIGSRPLDWFLSSFPSGHGGAEGRPSKGSLEHFLNCFPDDGGLRRYAVAADQPDRNQE